MKIPFKNEAKILGLMGAILLTPVVGFANADLDSAANTTGLSGSYLASRVAIDDNDDLAAALFLERAIKLDPENKRLQRDFFSALVANGRVEQAAELARKFENPGASDSIAGYVLAAEVIRGRAWNKVPSALKDVAGVDLDRVLREITLAWGQSGEGKADDAIARLDELEGPEWINAMKNYHGALIAAAAGNDDLAAEKFQSVIDNRAIISVLTETYIRAIEAMVRNRNKAGDHERAREVLNYGLDLLPSHAPFARLDAALSTDEVLKPLVSSPQSGMAELFYNIASAIRRDGAGDTAKSYLQIARFLAPKSDVITLGLAELYLQQRNYEKSNSFYSAIPETSPFYRISKLEKASNLARLEKVDDAIATLKEIIAENPNDLQGYLTIGGIYNSNMRYREAADTYDTAVEIIGEPKTHHWNLFFRRGIAYERLKEWEKAEPNFQKSLELSANQAEVLNYLGYSWIDQGINLDEGLEMIKKAVRLRPRSGFIVDSLGWAYYRLGRYEEAVQELERAVELMPQDPTINDHLGDAYWKTGRRLEATFQWKIALAAEDDAENPEEIKRKLKEGLDVSKKAEAKSE
ncbi:MAG: tetratricopeptide repeat protein [Pseudomonadota bacterium]